MPTRLQFQEGQELLERTEDHGLVELCTHFVLYWLDVNTFCWPYPLLSVVYYLLLEHEVKLS